MKKLPRFVLLSNPDEGVTDIVMETTPPYFLGKVYGIPKKETDRVEQMLADIANDRTTAIKMQGYTFFLSPYGSLLGQMLEKEQAKATLRDMADFYHAAVISRKKGKNRIYQEDVPDDIDRINGEKIRQAKAEGRRIFLDQK